MQVIYLSVVLLLIGVLFNFLPQLTRPDLFFAVTVNPEFRSSPEGARITKLFRATTWAFTFSAIAVEVLTRAALGSVLVLLAGGTVALVTAHARALEYAAQPNTNLQIDLGAPPETLPGGPIVLALPPLSLILLALWVVSHFQRLPPRIPVHWSLLGPNAWVMTTNASLLRFFGESLFMCAMLAAMAWGILNWTRRISLSGGRASSESRFRRHAVVLTIATEYFVVFQAWSAFFRSQWIVILWVAVEIVVLLLFIRFIWAGQGGSRGMAAAKGSPAGDRTPDSAWKLGMIYFNPADRAILVEKRFGIGYTINFGNRWAWVALAVLVAAWFVFSH